MVHHAHRIPVLVFDADWCDAAALHTAEERVTRFMICLTSERQEAANATHWAEDDRHLATKIPMTSRNGGALANTRNGDIVIIVAHGSNSELGTAATGLHTHLLRSQIFWWSPCRCETV
jgi:hypothetical protein